MGSLGKFVAEQSEHRSNPIDVHVGNRVRLRRKLLGLSQQRLGEAVGLTFQQVQKYELGSNRISASRLFDLSKALQVPVSFFFDEIDSQTYSEVNEDTPETDLVARRETLELVRAYYRIDNDRLRKRVFELVKSLSKTKVRLADEQID